ncbi:MAG TPA: sugar ABC transporter ATP-binding protein [Chloroflexota bacterium]
MLLEIRDVRKTFPGVVALDQVAIQLRPGEIHALLGENGAGKSTLIKIITGVYKPDSGQIFLDGQEVRFASPREAMKAGISVVHQERNLVPGFSVAENLTLERAPTRAGVMVDYGQMNDEARKWLSIVGLDIDPSTTVSDLSVAQMQLVEVAKALSLETSILLLDEPTASISPREAEFLFDVLRRLRDQGVSILFVSHKLEEIFSLCDHVTVLRDGKNTASGVELSSLDRDKVVTLMVGRAQIIKDLPPKAIDQDQVVLEVRNLATASGDYDVSFALHRGEVLGLYGLVGAGRTELAKALIGADIVVRGEIYVHGKRADIRSVREALERYRMGYVSENRKEEGLILLHSVVANGSITLWHRLGKALGWIHRGAERAAVAPYVEMLQIKTPSLFQTVDNLSGGNQQKVSLAKWLAADCEVLIIDEPTVGIDIKTKLYFQELIWDLAARGKSILLISSDMPEMIRLADRILVMRNHTIVGEVSNTHQYDEVSTAIGTLVS